MKDLDILILLKKIREKRKIVSISEIKHELTESEAVYRQIISYNPETEKWDILTDLFNTDTIKKLRKIEYIDDKRFYMYIQIYEDI